MPFEIAVDHSHEYLLVRGSGPASLGDLCGLFDLVRVSADKHGHTRALMDLTGVEIQFRFTDHLALGSHAANELSGLQRVASVVHPDFRVGTSERAAQQFGLKLRTFTDLHEATEWLTAADG